MARLGDHGMRPFIELEPTERPLAIEQGRDVMIARGAGIHAHFAYGEGGAR